MCKNLYRGWKYISVGLCKPGMANHSFYAASEVLAEPDRQGY